MYNTMFSVLSEMEKRFMPNYVDVVCANMNSEGIYDFSSSFLALLLLFCLTRIESKLLACTRENLNVLLQVLNNQSKDEAAVFSILSIIHSLVTGIGTNK